MYGYLISLKFIKETFSSHFFKIVVDFLGVVDITLFCLLGMHLDSCRSIN